MAEAGKRAFITGATGAVGGTLAERLLTLGWEVHALHRPTSQLANPSLHAIEGDIERPETLKGAIPRGVDAVFHVAADLSMWSRHDAQQMRVNVDGTRNVVNAALASAAGRFVHTSTISAYGRHPGPITEETPSAAEGSFVCYERSKWLAEQEVRKGIEQGLDAVILNPCAIMGAGFTGAWAMLFYQLRDGLMKALPPGDIVVNHIDAVVDAHVAAFEKGRTGENYILTGDPVPFADLISKAGELMGIDVNARVAPAWMLGAIGRVGDWASKVTGKEPALSPEMAAAMSQKLACPTDKARRELGYQEVPWQKSLSDMYDWLHARGDV